MYEDRVLAFIDVLGFSEAIKQTMSGKKENVSETNRINSLLELIHKDFAINKKTNLNSSSIEKRRKINGSRVVNQFSDSLVISFKINEESGIFFILIDILHLIMSSLQYGFLLRGAIVRNKLFHTQEKIFGPGLVEAYEMEKSLALFPRIVLDDDVIKLARKYHGTQNDPESEEEYVRQLVKKDFDGMNYINYFTDIEGEFDSLYDDLPLYYEKLFNEILKLKGGNTSLKSKYLWLKEKYNSGLIEYKRMFKSKDAKINYPEVSDYFSKAKKIR